MNLGMLLLLLVVFSKLSIVVSENCPPKPENISHHLQFVYGDSTDQAPGPSHWKDIWENCGGSRQSPININTSSVSKGDFPTLKITFDKPKGLVVGTLINTGYYPKLKIDKDNGTAKITGGLLDSTYTLDQFHVHFGCENDRGSEHTLDKKRFSGQLHLVFKDSKGDYAVVALWLKASDNGNKILERVSKRLTHIIYPGNTTEMKKSHKIDLIDLIPHKKCIHHGPDNGGGGESGGAKDNGGGGDNGSGGDNGGGGEIGGEGESGGGGESGGAKDNGGGGDNGSGGDNGGGGEIGGEGESGGGGDNGGGGESGCGGDNGGWGDNGSGGDNGGTRDSGNGNNGKHGRIEKKVGNSDNGHNSEKGDHGSLSKKIIILADYYHYQGSLTTPPCCENVMWFVMKEKVPISDSQLGLFGKLKTGEPGSNDYKDMCDNYRPLQDLNDRTVWSISD